MKDDKGLYYYPFPVNKKVKMYVKRDGSIMYFRMWNQDDPQMWEEHGWVPWQAIKKAIAMYKGEGFDPKLAYDIDVATTLVSGK